MASDEFDDDTPSATVSEAKKTKSEQASAKLSLPDRALLSLRVWVPALRTPAMKARQVKYRSSDARSGMTWKVGLPKQCYECGKTERLTLRKYSQEVRVLEAPTTIIGGTLGGALLLLCMAIVFGAWVLFFLSMAVVVMGAAFQFIKSWSERVKVNIFSCPEHLEDLTAPQVVSYDDDLYVFLPHESLTEPARAELVESRKKGQKQRPPLASDLTRHASANAPPPDSAPLESEAPPPSRTLGARTELPPLKLAGDDEE